MTRSRSKLGRFKDNMRRNVLSYRYLRHNIFMTVLVAAIALCVFAVISLGEKADPLADELYANDSVSLVQSKAVMMADGSVELAIDAAAPGDSVVSASNTTRVASSLGGTTGTEATEEPATEEPATEDTEVSGTATILYDGVAIMQSASDSAESLGTVDSGVIFDLVSVSDGWVCIQMFDGSTGYVSSDYVTVDVAE